MELRVYLSPSSIPVLHPLVELSNIGLLGGLFDQLALALALIVDEMTNVNVFVLVNFVTLTLTLVILPLPFIQANDKTCVYWLLIINQKMVLSLREVNPDSVAIFLACVWVQLP